MLEVFEAGCQNVSYDATTGVRRCEKAEMPRILLLIFVGQHHSIDGRNPSPPGMYKVLMQNGILSTATDDRRISKNHQQHGLIGSRN